jgi:hypothetical protein
VQPAFLVSLRFGLIGREQRHLAQKVIPRHAHPDAEEPYRTGVA